MIDTVLSALIVSLEQKINFQPNQNQNISSKTSKHDYDSIKSIYSGEKYSRSKKKVNYQWKLEKMDLSKCLYEAYLIGSQKTSSKMKRIYYSECK